MLGEFDFFSDEFQHNPGATSTHMIKESPVHKSAEHGGYSVFRYADIVHIFRDYETFSAGFGPGPGYAPQGGAPELVSADPPLHGKQKQAIVTAFHATTIATMEGPIRSFVNECLGAPLARLECRVFAEEFLRRIPEFEADGEAVPYPYATLNGLDNLPIPFPLLPTGATKP